MAAARPASALLKHGERTKPSADLCPSLDEVALVEGADCGGTKYKYLSYATALAHRDNRMPRTIDVSDDPVSGAPAVRSEPLGFWTSDAGRHKLCGTRDDGSFARYSKGIVMYFKFLRTGFFIFGLMTLLFSVHCAVFFAGDGLYMWLDPGETGATLAEQLSRVTAGNLGEAATLCIDAWESDAVNATVDLECEPGSRILRVEVAYGALSGASDCPALREPDFEEEHPGGPCGPREPYTVVSQSGRPVSLPNGYTFLDWECCASSTDGMGRADFSDLNFRYLAGADCAADFSALVPLVRGKCLGETHCSVPVDRFTLHEWTPREGYDTGCPVGAQVTPSSGASAAGVSCAVRLADRPGLSGCAGQFAYRPAGSAQPAVFPALPVPAETAPAGTEGKMGTRLVVVAQCYRDVLPSAVQGQRVTRTAAVSTLVWVDVLACVLLLSGALFLYWREEEIDGDDGIVTAADYTAVMHRLPPHRTLRQLEAGLTAHLEAALSRQPPVHNELPGGVKVATICFAPRNPNLMPLFTARGNTLRRVERLSKAALIAEVSLAEAEAAGASAAAAGHDSTTAAQATEAARCTALSASTRLRAALEGLRSQHAMLRALDRRIDEEEAGEAGGSRSLAAAAFITFETTEGLARCLAAYQSSAMGYLRQPAALRYEGTLRLHARRAPHPSDLLVENFPVSTSARLWRRLLSLLLVCAVLMFSLYLVQQATATKAAVQLGKAATSATSLVCRMQLGARLLDFTNASQVRDSVENAVARANGTLPAAWISCFCRGYASKAGWAKLFGAVAGIDGGDATGLSAARSSRPCQAYAVSNFLASLLFYGASTATVSINIVMNHIIVQLVACERHTSQTSALAARSFYMFLVQVVNTIVLVLLVNAYISPANALPLLTTTGKFTDFSAEWYRGPGVSIVLTMALQVATPHLWPLAEVAIQRLRLLWDRGCSGDVRRTRQLAQSDLNALQAGTTFAIDERYAQIMSATATCLAFATGLPLLIPILAATYAVMFFVDKWLFIRYYAALPQTDGSLGRQFTALLPLIVLLRLGFSIWMFTAQDIFAPGLINGVEGFSRRATQYLTSLDPVALQVSVRFAESHVAPLVALMVLLAAAYLLRALILNVCMRRAPDGACTSLCRRFLPIAADLGRRTTANAPAYFEAVPPDVFDDVEAGVRRVKPTVAARLRALAARERLDDRTSLLERHSRYVGALRTLRQLRATLTAQGEAFVKAVAAAQCTTAPASGDDGDGAAAASRRGEPSAHHGGASAVAADHRPARSGGCSGSGMALTLRAFVALRIEEEDPAGTGSGAGTPADSGEAAASSPVDANAAFFRTRLPLRRLLTPSTLGDAEAVAQRLLAALTLPPGLHGYEGVDITPDEAALHVAAVRANADEILARVERRADDALHRLRGLLALERAAQQRRCTMLCSLGGAEAGATLHTMSSGGGGAACETQSGSSAAGGKPGGGTSATGPAATPGHCGEARLLSGLWTYELHENPAYQARFGLDAVVAPALKRRLRWRDASAAALPEGTSDDPTAVHLRLPSLIRGAAMAGGCGGGWGAVAAVPSEAGDDDVGGDVRYYSGTLTSFSRARVTGPGRHHYIPDFDALSAWEQGDDDAAAPDTPAPSPAAAGGGGQPRKRNTTLRVAAVAAKMAWVRRQQVHSAVVTAAGSGDGGSGGDGSVQHDNPLLRRSAFDARAPRASD